MIKDSVFKKYIFISSLCAVKYSVKIRYILLHTRARGSLLSLFNIDDQCINADRLQQPVPQAHEGPVFAICTACPNRLQEGHSRAGWEEGLSCGGESTHPKVAFPCTWPGVHERYEQ